MVPPGFMFPHPRAPLPGLPAAPRRVSVHPPLFTPPQSPLIHPCLRRSCATVDCGFIGSCPSLFAVVQLLAWLQFTLGSV